MSVPCGRCGRGARRRGTRARGRYHFTQTVGEWPAVTKRDVPTPADEAAGMALIDDLQDCKTEAYKRLVSQASPRPGILEMMDAAIADEKIAVGICSASTRAGFEKVVDAIVGQPRLEKAHSPHALISLRARRWRDLNAQPRDVTVGPDHRGRRREEQETGPRDLQPRRLPPRAAEHLVRRRDVMSTQAWDTTRGHVARRCLVVEDSLVGLRAARGAGMRCVITYLQARGRDGCTLQLTGTAHLTILH